MPLTESGSGRNATIAGGLQERSSGRGHELLGRVPSRWAMRVRCSMRLLPRDVAVAVHKGANLRGTTEAYRIKVAHVFRTFARDPGAVVHRPHHVAAPAVDLRRARVRVIGAHLRDPLAERLALAGG